MIILFLLFGKHHPSGIYSGTRGKHRSAPRGQCTRGTLYMAGPHVIFIQGCPSRGLAMSPSFPLGHGSPRGKIDLGSWPHQKKKIFCRPTTNQIRFSMHHNRCHRARGTIERPPHPSQYSIPKGSGSPILHRGEITQGSPLDGTGDFFKFDESFLSPPHRSLPPCTSSNHLTTVLPNEDLKYLMYPISVSIP